MITGKIRAWIEHCCAKQGVLAAFIGVPSEGDAPLRRPPATRFCASLVETWLAAAEITSGPVFRAVGRGGRVSCDALEADSAARIVEALRERRVGLDAAAYAAHSLRSGFLTSAAESGASIWKMADQSRHRSLDTLRGYVRRVDMFREHAGATFL